MNLLSLSHLIPMNYTSAYYNELIPLSEALSNLYHPLMDSMGKRASLAMIRSVYQTGNSDKIKACLDLRLPKHVIKFLQEDEAGIRKESLLILLEISKGLKDEESENISQQAASAVRSGSPNKTASELQKMLNQSQSSILLEDPRRAKRAGKDGIP